MITRQERKKQWTHKRGEASVSRTLLAILMSIFMVCSSVPASAWAEGAEELGAAMVAESVPAEPASAQPMAEVEQDVVVDDSVAQPEVEPAAESDAPEGEPTPATEPAETTEEQQAPKSDPEDTNADDTAGAEEAAEEQNAQTSFVYKDDAVRVTATVDDPTVLPAGATLRVSRVTPNTPGYNYGAYMGALNAASGEDGVYNDDTTLLYDVAFLAADESGQFVEVQPARGDVHVDFAFKPRATRASRATRPATARSRPSARRSPSAGLATPAWTRAPRLTSLSPSCISLPTAPR